MRGTNSSRYDKPSRPRASDTTAKPQTEALAWARLVRRRKLTAEQARQAIGVSPRQARELKPHWVEYRALVLEFFNRSFPGEKIVLESRGGAEQHRRMFFSRKPDTVPVKMLVSISGEPDELVSPRAWSFDRGDIVEINPGRAVQWQNTGKCLILSSEKAMQAARAPNGEKPLDDLESILRASGRCAECEKPATRVLGITPLCVNCYSRALFVQGVAR